MIRLNFFALSFSVLTLILIAGIGYVLAQPSSDVQDRTQQSGQLIIENTNLLRAIVELIPTESNMNQAQPFPQELQEATNAAIDRFISHSNNLLLLSEGFSSTSNNANCINMLANSGQPSLESMRTDYMETRETALPSSDQNLQLVNLWGYSLLVATSFSPRAPNVHMTLATCSGFGIP